MGNISIQETVKGLVMTNTVFDKLKSIGDGLFHCGGWWIFSKGWINIHTYSDGSIRILYTTHENHSTRMMGEEGHARCATYYSNGDVKYIGKQDQKIELSDRPEEVLKFLERRINLVAIKVDKGGV